MENRRLFTSVLGILLITVLYPSYAVAWEFDGMLSGVEKRLPIAEQQATVIVKMLNNEEHLAKLQSDIDKIKDHKYFKAKDAYLYRVFRAIDNGSIAFEKSAICANLIFNKGPSSYYSQPLYPLFLVSLAGGNYRNFLRNSISEDKAFLMDPGRADGLVGLCNRIMEIQKAVLYLAKDRLNIEGIGNSNSENGGSYSSRGGPNQLGKNADAKYIYSIFFPGRVDYQTVIYNDVIDENEYLKKYPVSYLTYLKSQAEFLKTLNFASNLGSSGDWDKYIGAIDRLIADKSGALGLDGLSPKGKKSSGGNSENSDLNIDDLKLPK